MSIYDYKQAYISMMRKEYLHIIEPHQIVGGKCQLSEIPDEMYGVRVKDEDDNTYVNTLRQTPKENEYYVDYVNSLVYFHPSQNLKTLIFDFFGKGINFISASRIFVKEKNGTEVIETLEDVISSVDHLVELDQELTGNENERKANEIQRQISEQIREAFINELKHAGEYDNDTQYIKNNFVRYNGSTYMALKDSLGNIPTDNADDENWRLVARRGLDGDGVGTVIEVKSTNGDISILNPTDYPELSINPVLKEKWNNAEQNAKDYTDQEIANLSDEVDSKIGILSELDDQIIDYLVANGLDINVVNSLNYLRRNRSSKEPQSTPEITYPSIITYGDEIVVSWNGQSANGYTVDVSLDDGLTWLNFYEGIETSKNYTISNMGNIVFRVKANGDEFYFDSDWKIGISVVVQKAIQQPPNKPTLIDVQGDSIEVNSDAGSYVRLSTIGVGYPSPHTFTGLNSNTSYTIYAYYPETSTHLESENSEGLVVETISMEGVYGVKIDETNSNPFTAVTYIDDAIGMTGGSTDWDTKFPFNQIRPVLFKDGQVVVELNKNDFSKNTTGGSVNITTGASGDVMIEFPKIWWKIQRIGTDLYVRYADRKIDSSWKCHAHTRGNEERDYVYIGAYLGCELSGKLRSLSGKTPTNNKKIGEFRTLAQSNGNGYEQMPYFQLLMLQILYLVRYKSRDYRALGMGYLPVPSHKNTGGTNTKGMYFADISKTQQLKFSGIEDFWGNYYCWIDGLYSDLDRNILIGNDNFNNDGSGYINYGQGSLNDIDGYISEVQGDTEKGFIIKQGNGSDTTYYTGLGSLLSGSIATFSGIDGTEGAFGIIISRKSSFYNIHHVSRLVYL